MPQSLMLHIEHLDRSLFDRGEQLDIDLYLLGYYLGGIGLKDLAHLTWDKIKGTELDCQAMSYPHVAAIAISDKALEIIERYKEINRSGITSCPSSATSIKRRQSRKDA